MRTTALLLAALPLCAAAPTLPMGEEFVRNGGFELLDGEVYTYDQLKQAFGWSNVTLGLSEVFDSTASAKTVGSPENDYGTMKPFEGQHYAGFFAWKDDMRRNWDDDDDPFMPGWSAYSEYLQSELVKPLLEGHFYQLTMRVALSGNSDRAVSALGAYCSEIPIKHDHRRFLDEQPQVATEKILDAKGEWVEITDIFEADGGERYILIGTWPMAGFDNKRVIVGNDNQYAYYYLDGISLKEVPKPE